MQKHLFFVLIMVGVVGISFLNTVSAKNTPAPPKDTAVYLTPDNGLIDAFIIIPARATEIERYAAAEMKSCIQKIADADIPIITEENRVRGFCIYIGITETGRPFALRRTSRYDGANGFTIKSVPDGLVIIGGDDLGTLYGVYHFLEEYQDCAWILPNKLGEIIPERKQIVIPENIDITETPDIAIRWMDRGDWALKNKMNVDISINGHDVGVVNKWNYHTFRLLVPDKNYLDVHPEYFSLGDEKRIGGDADNGRGQICTSNPEVIRLVSQHLMNELKQNPNIDFISLTPNDWFGFCRCSRCEAQIIPEYKENRQGAASGPIHIFNNAVARRVGKFCPGQHIKVGAYMGYLRYPLDPSYKPEENLAFMFTPHIHYCHNHPVTDRACPYIDDFMREYYKWTDHTSHLHIFAYECLHGWANLIWPMVHTLKFDMPEYRRTGVEQFFTQTMSQTMTYALNYYVASKLAWNSSLSADKLVSDFCRKAYGTAGGEMEAFHTYLENSWERNPAHVAYWTAPVPVSIKTFFTPAVMTDAERLLRKAESVSADSLSKERIKLVRAEFDYLRLVINYLDNCAAPFVSAEAGDEQEMEQAAQDARSSGSLLASVITAYYDKYMPREVQTGWPRTGLESLLRTHTRPQLLRELAELY